MCCYRYVLGADRSRWTCPPGAWPCGWKVWVLRGWSEDPATPPAGGPLWEPLPAAGAPYFGESRSRQPSRSLPTAGRVGSGGDHLGEREVGMGPWAKGCSGGRDSGRFLSFRRGSGAQPPVTASSLGLASSLPAAWGSPARSALLPAAAWEISSRHLLLEAHLEALSVDEEDGFLFLENSIPSPFPASAPEAQSTLRPRGPVPVTLAAPQEGQQRGQSSGPAGCGHDTGCH